MSKRHIQYMPHQTFCGRQMHPADMTTLSAHRDGFLVSDCKQCLKAIETMGNTTNWLAIGKDMRVGLTVNERLSQDGLFVNGIRYAFPATADKYLARLRQIEDYCLRPAK